MSSPSFYQFLQIDPTSRPEVVDAAYRHLKEQYESTFDASESTRQILAELNHAYEILSDPLKRQAYDANSASACFDKVPTLAAECRQSSPTTQIPINRSKSFDSQVDSSYGEPLRSDKYRITRAIYLRYLFISCVIITCSALLVATVESLADTRTIALKTTQERPMAIHAVANKSEDPLIAGGSRSVNEVIHANIIDGNETITQRNLRNNPNAQQSQEIPLAQLDSLTVQLSESTSNGIRDAVAELSHSSVKTLADISKLKPVQLLPMLDSISGNKIQLMNPLTGSVNRMSRSSIGNGLADLFPQPKKWNGSTVGDLRSKGLIKSQVLELALSNATVILANDLPIQTQTKRDVSTVAATSNQPSSSTVSLPNIGGNPLRWPITLQMPANGAVGGGEQQFQWQSDLQLDEGQAYELVFWRKGDDPLSESIGLAKPTPLTTVSLNLDALDFLFGPLLDPGQYRWGVLLVTPHPYLRHQLLTNGNDFTFINYTQLWHR